MVNSASDRWHELNDPVMRICGIARVEFHDPIKLGHNCCGGCKDDHRVETGYKYVEFNQYDPQLWEISLETITKVANAAFPDLKLSDLAVVVSPCGYDGQVDLRIQRKCCPHTYNPREPELDKPCPDAIFPEGYLDPRKQK